MGQENFSMLILYSMQSIAYLTCYRLFCEYYNISRRLLEISIYIFNHFRRMYHFYFHLTHYHLTFVFCLFYFHFSWDCLLLIPTLLLFGRAALFRLPLIVYLIVFLAFDMGKQEDKYTQLLTEY